MLKQSPLLPYFISEGLFILPEEQQVLNLSTQVSENVKGVKSQAASPAAPAEEKVQPEAQDKNRQASAIPPPSPREPEPNPNLIFGKNAKQLLILVEDHQNPVMERADGLFLKDVLKAIGFTFDDVAIVNICHCREEVDWQTVNDIPFKTMFSFGISHPKLPFTKALAPYKLEKSGYRTFLLADKIDGIRADRAIKVRLWNLLKQLFV